jgi:hypothetical protein
VGGVASPSILLVATLAEGALSSFVLNLVPTKKTISLNSSFFFSFFFGVQIFLIETKSVKALELYWEGGGRELLLLLLLPLQFFLQS